jgi:hypothetical protein
MSNVQNLLHIVVGVLLFIRRVIIVAWYAASPLSCVTFYVGIPNVTSDNFNFCTIRICPVSLLRMCEQFHYLLLRVKKTKS